MKRIQLTQNFYLDEFTRSATAERHSIDISLPNDVYLDNLQRLCQQILQPTRDHFGPILIHSGFRPLKLNTLVGGAKNSSHLYAAAADFDAPGYNTYEVALWISANLDNYEQVINEFGQWIHASVSITERSSQLPKTDLTAVKIPRQWRKPKTIYVPGIVTVDAGLESVK